MEIEIGARDSKLSKMQVQEILAEIQSFEPSISFLPTYVKTTGDLNQSASLRSMDKTNFFTKEIDEMLANGVFRLAIHSAKDLPDPLPEELTLFAVTKGVDPSDSLVLRKRDTLISLPQKSRIGSSSIRRDEMVLSLRPDFICVDVRGTVEQRLDALTLNKIDGLVVAEAALIRLGLVHLNRISLNGVNAPLQGRLAIVGRKGDLEMQKLFEKIDCVNSPAEL